MILPPSKEKRGPESMAGKKILTGVWKKRQVEFVEGELVIKLATDKSQEKATIDKLLTAELKGAKIARQFDRFGVGVLAIEGDVLGACESLRDNPNVAFAEPNFVDRATVTVPNDTEYAARQWSLPLIGMPEAWDIEQGDPNVLIAIVDSGIPMQGAPLALSHPDLNDAARIILGNDLVSGTATPQDDCGHGTHVASIASAQSNNAIGITGMAWATRLYIVKVFDANGNGTSQRFHDAVVEAVDYAQLHGLRLVINYSGGGAPAALKEQAVQYAQSHNSLLVCAAGNDYGGNVIHPAAYSATYDNVIAVSATDSSDALANYSNVGPEICVAAPGSHIYSCMPNYSVHFNTAHGFSQNYDYMDGTSMATPHVSGLAALILSYDNTLTAAVVRTTIEDTTVDLGPAGWDQSFGHGRIDAHAALDSLAPAEVCPVIKEVCFIKTEVPCSVKEFCLYIKEVGGCAYKLDIPGCSLIKEVGCIKKLEVIGPCLYMREVFCPREGCLREMPGLGQGCSRESPISDPWGQIVIRRGDPSAEPMVIYRRLKHVKPLTPQSALSRRKVK